MTKNDKKSDVGKNVFCGLLGLLMLGATLFTIASISNDIVEFFSLHGHLTIPYDQWTCHFSSKCN